MDYALVGVLVVVILVIVSVFSRRLGVAAPVVLVVVGLGIGLIPGTPTVVLPSAIILEAVLPPLLYSAAIRLPVIDLRRNLRSISVLSVLLVIGTAFAVAAIAVWLFPGIGFGPALALGAVVSPTDAVAATAVAKRMGLPPRLVTLLEGESLVNDASALVMLRVALGATAAAITFWGVVGQLLFAIFVAIILGLVIGAVTVRFRARLQDPVLDTVVSYAAPFVAFLPTEALGASGVIAVVTLGIYTGHAGVRLINARARLAERINWSTVQFLLENGVFLVMGLQLKGIVERVNASRYDVTVLDAVWYGLLVAAALLVTRALVMAPLIWRLSTRASDLDAMGERLEQMMQWVRRTAARVTDDRTARRVAMAEKRIVQRTGDVADLRRDRIDLRGGAVATWAGMRGVVTLAAAQSIPETTPYRAELVLVAFVVAIATLLIQGGTLPWIIRLVKVSGTDEEADARELASLMDELYQVGQDVLAGPVELEGGTVPDESVVQWLRDDLTALRDRAHEHVDNVTSETVGPHGQYRMLLAKVLEAERQALLEARERGEYASRVIGRAQRELDAEEARLQPPGE